MPSHEAISCFSEASDVEPAKEPEPRCRNGEAVRYAAKMSVVWLAALRMIKMRPDGEARVLSSATDARVRGVVRA